MIKTLLTNCTIVYNYNITQLYSYDTLIIEVTSTINYNKITKVTNYWDYSTTTSKHLNAFLRDIGLYDIAKMTRVQKRAFFKEEGLI